MGLNTVPGLISDYKSPSDIHRFLNQKDFGRVIKQATRDLQEDMASIYITQNCQEQLEIQLLVYTACVQPDLVEYVIQTLIEISPGLVEERFVSAIDSILFFPPREYYSLFNSNPNTGPKPLARSHIARVLERFLKFSPRINDTMFWQFSIWRDLVWNRALSTPLLDILIDAGADINMHLSDRFESFIRDEGWLFLPYRKEFMFPFPAKPIDVAFALSDPTVFCHLLPKISNTNDLICCIKSYAGDENAVDTEFTQAVRIVDISRIKKYWNWRIQTLNTAFTSALRVADLKSIKRLMLKHQHQPVMLSWVRLVCQSIAKESPNPALYDCVIKILRSLQISGYTFRQIPRFLEPDCEEKYSSSLLSTMESQRIELLNLIITLGVGPPPNFFSTSMDPDSEATLQRIRVYMVSNAAKISLDVLKFLVQKGFSINEFYRNPIGSEVMSPVQCALVIGNMDILTYLLQQGANIYAPCDFSPSAIAYSISLGRLDALALFLEVEPRCYSIALEAAKNTAYDYIKNFLSDWKPPPIVEDWMDSDPHNNIVGTMELFAP
ncbi:hypothetical protein TWF694_005361 [Orbilia ellipsospora]|uniref:Ankyrin repeat protein n=1 Tax=Orbilia ellipsospora TaxID=2528407 RepID=A0AAV9WUG2_9PEZI